MTSLSTASGLGIDKGVCPLFQPPVRLIALSFYWSRGILEQFNPAEQAAQLRASRARSRALTLDLRGGQWFGPRLPIVNPVLWELGHIAWFQERWCLRWRAGGSLAASVLPDADA